MIHSDLDPQRGGKPNESRNGALGTRWAVAWGMVARAAVPDARVAYVDNDDVVVAHARALLATDPLVNVISKDAREHGGNSRRSPAWCAY